MTGNQALKLDKYLNELEKQDLYKDDVKQVTGNEYHEYNPIQGECQFWDKPEFDCAKCPPIKKNNSLKYLKEAKVLGKPICTLDKNK